MLAMSLPAVADESQSYCPATVSARSGGAEMGVSADRVVVREKGVSILDGEAQFDLGSALVRADKVTYDSRSEKVKAKGNVRYTNCDPKDPWWFISADEVSYDIPGNRGLVENAWLHFANVPVLYMPRYWFSTSDSVRKSGFLAPEIGNSSTSGREISVPFYFNWAPNKDVTFEPRYYSKRGTQLNVESRYLYKLDRGNFEFSTLDDSEFNQERHAYKYNHVSAVGDKFSVELDLQYVSDDEYLEDFSRGFNVYGESYLRSHISMNWFYRGWDMKLSNERLARSSDVESSERPYQKRPHFSIGKRFDLGDTGLSLDVLSDTTQFVNKNSYIEDEGVRTDVDRGIRFHNVVDMQWLYRRPGFHFTPQVSLGYTRYKLYGTDDHNRTLPSFSLHTGLVFEKDLHRSRYRHTLEPELFYLNVPYRKQDDLPDFDTSENEFRFARLFDRNRFNGIDRIGDADQVSAALTSRLVHKRSGIEALRMSVGRTFYFRNRRVNLSADDAGPTATDAQLSGMSENKSDLAGEVAVNLNNKVRFLSSLIWDSEENETERGMLMVSLNGGAAYSASLFYGQKRDDFEQAGISANFPIGGHWKLFGAASYDVDSKQSLNTLAGIEYSDCCFSARIGFQRRLNDVTGAGGAIGAGGLDHDNFIGLQLNLHGVGRVGDDVNSMIENSSFLK